MSLKVCHVTSVHGRYDPRIFQKECTSLARNGYDVTLIVADGKESEVMNGVKIVSTDFSARSRIERFTKLKKYISKIVLEIDADVYHFHDPDLLSIAVKMCKQGKKVIFDFHEDVPSQILDKPYLPNVSRKLVSLCYAKFEKRIVPQLDAAISVTPKVVDRLKEINPNTVQIANFPIINDKSLYSRPQLEARRIVFAGGISEQWCHEQIISAISEIEDVEYVLAGSASEAYLAKLKSLDGWKKVKYLGIIPFAEVNELYRQCSIGLAINYSTQGGVEGTMGNTKLFEIMGAGLPVICTDYTIWKEIVAEGGCGICVNPRSVEDIKVAINTLFSDTQLMENMGKNGRKLVLERFNWGVEEKTLLSLYETLTLECSELG